MSNLKELVWKNGDTCSHIKVSAKSPLHGYFVSQASGNDEISVGYYENSGKATRYATGFATIDEAKQWAWNHYNEKMQPYVKPAPTWIDVNERLPERKELLTDKDKCLVLTECGKVWTGFYNMHVKPDDWYLHGWTEKKGWHPFKIVAWMLASEFSTMQKNKGE